MEDTLYLISDCIDILSDAGLMEDANKLFSISEKLPAMPEMEKENTLHIMSDMINKCDSIMLYSVSDMLFESIVSLRDLWGIPD